MLGAWSIVHSTDSVLGAFFSTALAKCLASHGKRVLLFELNSESPAIDTFLGVDERVVYTLSDVGNVFPGEVVLSPMENLSFVPMAVGEKVTTIEPLAACLMARDPDVVLISADRHMLSLADGLSDGKLLLTDASHVSMRSAEALSAKNAFSGFILTDFIPTRESIEKAPNMSSLADALGLPLCGILPRVDPNNSHTVTGKDFLCAVENMAGRLTGEHIPLLRGISLEGMRKRAFFAT